MAIPEKILKKVEKPARYTGGEWGQTIKDKKDIDIRFAFCFPDTYEIGMSNLGIRILYDVLNARADTWCERVYAPWTDMENICANTIYRSSRSKAATRSVNLIS